MVKPHEPVLVPTGLINLTDHDSRPMRTHGYKPLQGYNAQLAYTLTGESRIYKLEGGKFDAIKLDRSRIAVEQTGYGVQQSCLATPARTQETEDFSLPRGK